MNRILHPGALLLASSLAQAAPYPNTSHFGVPFSEDEAWYQQCKRVEQRSAPGLAEAKAKPMQCDAGTLYYAKRAQARTSDAEWKRVRECALASEDHAVLTMLYANGFGVARDSGIAIHHACRMDSVAKAEMEARVKHLGGPPQPGAVFDQCDDITSGYMGSVCAGIAAGQGERERTVRLNRVASGLPASARTAFTKLRQAAGRYAEALETDMQGTGAAGRAIDREARQLAQFDQLLEQVLGKTLPEASAQDLASVDRELNAVYRSLMAPAPSEAERPERIGQSTITRQEVREAERRWIVYRDTFVAFRAALPQGPSPEAIGLALTRERLAALRHIAQYRR